VQFYQGDAHNKIWMAKYRMMARLTSFTQCVVILNPQGISP